MGPDGGGAVSHWAGGRGGEIGHGKGAEKEGNREVGGPGKKGAAEKSKDPRVGRPRGQKGPKSSQPVTKGFGAQNAGKIKKGQIHPKKKKGFSRAGGVFGKKKPQRIRLRAPGKGEPIKKFQVLVGKVLAAKKGGKLRRGQKLGKVKGKKKKKWGR